MAALWFFTRSAATPSLRAVCATELISRTSPTAYKIQDRWSTFQSSPIYEESGTYTNFDRSKSPSEWKYVQRLINIKTVPQPPTEEKTYSSCWKPATAHPSNFPYFISRTKNHMQPLYLRRKHRGMQRVTVIRKIHGDIWSLEKDIKAFLQEETTLYIPTKLNEFAGTLIFKGDYVSLIKKWMDDKGF